MFFVVFPGVELLTTVAPLTVLGWHFDVTNPNVQSIFLDLLFFGAWKKLKKYSPNGVLMVIYHGTGMSMVLTKLIITPMKVGWIRPINNYKPTY